MNSQRWITGVAATLGCALAFAGCKEEAPKPATPAPAAASAEAAKAAEPAKPAEPVAPANPVAAELAPLWPDIAKCEDTSDLYAQEKCPANYKLLEATKAAYAEVEKNPQRFTQLYDALVDQVINGTDLKARNCAGYAAWSKGYRGGKAFEDNAKVASDLIAAMGKLEKEDGGIGYSIANMVSAWWKKDGQPRKEMVAIIQDKAFKSTGGRRELIRHGAWSAKDYPAVLSAIRTVATDTSEDMFVRREAISSLGGVLRDVPEVVETLLFVTSESNEVAQKEAIDALSSAKPGTPEAAKAQAKLVELLGAADPNPLASGAMRSLGRIADFAGLETITAYAAARADNAAVARDYTSAIQSMVHSGRFKGDAKAEAILRKGAEGTLKAATTAMDKRWALETVGALGGPKSVATCKKFAKDADPSVVEAANKCVEKATAATAAK